MGVLLTGGAGYIGSHTAVELLQAGHDVVIIDDLSNSTIDVLDNIKRITGKNVTFYEMDLLDKSAIYGVFEQNVIESVIHFAGYKAVGESVEKPLKYYQNNLISTLNLCEVMQSYDVYNLVFSSSATVYGIPEKLPLDETCQTSALNPYGQTKLMIEHILTDLAAANDNWNIVSLRYFNPVGAHESGFIGENPNGIPTNLMPYISQIASGKLEKLRVFGGDYPTIDGTGVRDYIHVVDLARGHAKALEQIGQMKGIEFINLGTGQGYSVLEVVQEFERATGVTVPYEIVERRPGDVSTCYANADRALQRIGWKASKTLYDMCKDAWQWEQQKSPISVQV